MLEIVHIQAEPIEQISYLAPTPGSQSVDRKQLPIYRGTVRGLPDCLKAVIVTSDLQGVMEYTAFDGIGGEVERLADSCSITMTDQQFISTTAPSSTRRRSHLLGEALPEMLELLLQMDWPHIHKEQVMLLLCGDLYADVQKRGASGSPMAVWEAFQQTFVHMAAVSGNHDIFAEQEKKHINTHQEAIWMLEPQLQQMQDLHIAGLSGITGRPDKPNRMPEPDFLKQLGSLLRKSPDVLVMHQGPDDPSNCRPGDQNVRVEVEKYSPVLICCGHVGWQTEQGQEHYARLQNGTQVLNADGKVFILVAE
ncbi:metallophosphoesterase family protein [Paenibacillus kandeliae]|uniref:metallophosphoesterase family protein n=1 Tax=Paenibacillus kandeliae TaxID=3231269 RepID=UPI00345846D9